MASARWQLWTGLLALANALAVHAQGRNNDLIGDAAYLQPQQLVAVEGGRRLNVHCTGSGSPVVVFDSALGGDMADWGLVQPQVAKATRACSYDRAGLGFSDPVARARDSAFMAGDLHQLLRAAGIPAPYVLVGHSLGGLNIKLFAQTWAEEVAGMVFVDPTHEDVARRSWELAPELGGKNQEFLKLLRACLTAKPADFVPGTRMHEECAVPPNAERFSPALNAVQVERLMKPGYMGAWISEQENVWTASAAQLRAARRPLGSIPLIVLTHEPLARRDGETQAMRDAQNAIRTELHADIASLSTRGRVRMVKNSGHYFQFDQPQEVVEAVLEVVRAVRKP